MRYILVVVGLGLMAWGFVYDASVDSASSYGAVLNLGLIAEKQMIFGLGAVFFLAGIILVGTTGVAEALRPATKASGPPSPQDMKPGYTVGPVLKGTKAD